jgi:glycosyltransferase involved in cell wall biosynthesis
VPESDPKESYVAILDLQNIILKGGRESIERHKTYLDTLHNITPQQQKINLRIFAPFEERFTRYYKDYNFIVPIKTKALIKWPSFILKIITIIYKDRKYINMLIAGDPWFPAVLSIFISKIIKSKILVQTQIHADLGSEKWRKLSIKNYVKFALSRYTLYASDSIRFVSEEQYRKVACKIKIDPNKVFVAGIIYPLPEQPIIKKLNTDKVNIGMIGRISSDRGLNEFTKIIYKLNSLELYFDLYIAGSGKQKKTFQRELIKTHKRGDVFFLGHIEGEELINFWRNINFCIFTPQSESFGRGLREALVNSTPIWSTNTSGFEELEHKFKCNEIKQISSEMSNEILLNAFNNTKNLKVEFDYMEYFKNEQRKDLDKLVESFVHTRKLET